LLPLLLDPDYRLLTLTGVGGVGKTRLALEAGAKMTAHFSHGAWFVSLVGVTEQSDDADLAAETIATAVAQVLSVTLTGQGTAQAQLWAALKRKEMLLILDNFEHLQAGVGLVTALLAQCPAVKLLLTSRTRLNLQSEVHVPLAGLPVGEAARPAAAVELFQERAERVDFSFVLAAGERPLAIQLCQFLEGVPLSIELAAGWIDRQPLAEIVTTIAQDLEQMATTMADVPERQRSMRAVFAGSWRLLSASEQQVLARLAVFRGGFELAAVDAVAGKAQTAVLSNLVEHFLLRQAEGVNGRYDLHELLRQFSFEKLTELGLLAEVQARHGRYYLNFVAQQETIIRQEWLAVREEIEVELGNIRQAWAWAADVMDVDLLTAVQPAIYALYRSANLFREGQQLLAKTAVQVETWLQQNNILDENRQQLAQTLLNQLQIDNADFLNKLGRGKDVPIMIETAVTRALQLGNMRQQAAAEMQWGIGLIGKGDFNKARTHLTQAHTLAEAIHDEELLAECLVHLGLSAWYQSDYSLAREYCQGSLYLSLQTGNKRTQMPAYILLGLIAKELNLFEEALKNNTAALTVAQELRDRHWEGVARNNWGSICENTGDFEQAKMHYEQSLVIRRETGYLEGESSTLNNLGNVLRCLGDLPSAQSYLQQSLVIRQQMQDRNGEAWSLLNLGLVARWMGRAIEAVTYGKQAVAIWHDIGERNAEANALCALGTSLVNMGAYEQAETHLLAALRLAGEVQNHRIEAMAQHNLGVLACERGEMEQARTYLQQALTIRQKLNKGRSAAESQAWLAWLAFKQEHDVEAGGLLGDVVERVMGDERVTAMERPFRVYHICYHLLQKLDTPQANALLAVACQHLQAHASKFVNETDRRAFLEDVPDHHLIAQATACKEKINV
jgi:predicted ATPase/Tfp pilus assembly protein PilF